MFAYGDEVRGTYRVEDHIGAGAFGDVYLVRHRYMGMQAMKVLGRSASEEDLKTGLNEAFMLSRLSHPNIVRVYEANHVKEDPTSSLYVTMEYINGDTLRELIDDCGGSIEIDLALSLLRDAASGLAHAHGCDPQVIHRDIRPENLLIRNDADRPILLIGDFGMSGPINKSFGFLDRAGAVIYESPEGLDGYEGPRSDVFSLGLVFYELLTGVFPYPRSLIFDSSSSESLIGKLKEAQQAGFREAVYFRSSIPIELSAVLEVMVSIELEDRFTSGTHLLQVLDLVARCQGYGQQDLSEISSHMKTKAHDLLVSGMRKLFTSSDPGNCDSPFAEAASIHPLFADRFQPFVEHAKMEKE